MKINLYQINWQDYDNSETWLFLHVDAHGKAMFEQHIYQVIKDHIDEYLKSLPEYHSVIMVPHILDFVATKMIDHGYTYVADEEITQVFTVNKKWSSIRDNSVHTFLSEVFDFVNNKHQQYDKSKK